MVGTATPKPPHVDDVTPATATALPATSEPTAPAIVAPSQGQQPPAAPAQAPAAQPKAPGAQPKAVPVALPVTASSGNAVPWLMLVLAGGLLVAGGLFLRQRTIS